MSGKFSWANDGWLENCPTLCNSCPNLLKLNSSICVNKTYSITVEAYTNSFGILMLGTFYSYRWV